MPVPTDFTSAAAVKVALNLPSTSGDDANIAALVPQATAWLLREMDRPKFFQNHTAGTATDETAFLRVHEGGSDRLFLPRYPAVTITSLWVSTTIPRVYDATTLLTDGTHYLLDADLGVVYRVGSDWPDVPLAVKAVYNGGYAAVPAEMERAAQELIAFWLQKGKNQLYHLTGTQLGDGQVEGVRYDAPQTVIDACWRYRDLRTAA